MDTPNDLQKIYDPLGVSDGPKWVLRDLKGSLLT